MEWEVSGADRQTGDEKKLIIEAPDEASAERRANRQGLMVSAISPTSRVSGPPAISSMMPMAPIHVDVRTVAAPKLPAPWKPFVAEGQDEMVVYKLYHQVMSILTSSESLVVLVVQKKPLVTLSPDAMAATTKRVIAYETKMLGGMSMHDFTWKNLSDAQIREGIFGATLSFNVVGRGQLSMDHLPKTLAREFYRFAQEQEEKAVTTRRELDLEASRAAAGGVTVNNLTGFAAPPIPSSPPALPPSSNANADPVARLQAIKNMLSAGLIDQSEFDAKKAEILRSI